MRRFSAGLPAAPKPSPPDGPRAAPLVLSLDAARAGRLAHVLQGPALLDARHFAWMALLGRATQCSEKAVRHP